jgi:ferritin-like metal-binding protein YciE
MSIEGIAVETIVVEELQRLYAAEAALEKMYTRLSMSPEMKGSTGAFLDRLTELSARAARLETMLDTIGLSQEQHTNAVIC